MHINFIHLFIIHPKLSYTNGVWETKVFIADGMGDRMWSFGDPYWTKFQITINFVSIQCVCVSLCVIIRCHVLNTLAVFNSHILLVISARSSNQTHAFSQQGTDPATGDHVVRRCQQFKNDFNLKKGPDYPKVSVRFERFLLSLICTEHDMKTKVCMIWKPVIDQVYPIIAH